MLIIVTLNNNKNILKVGNLHFFSSQIVDFSATYTMHDGAVSVVVFCKKVDQLAIIYTHWKKRKKSFHLGKTDKTTLSKKKLISYTFMGWKFESKLTYARNVNCIIFVRQIIFGHARRGIIIDHFFFFFFLISFIKKNTKSCKWVEI
jgi:hypothetical protein